MRSSYTTTPMSDLVAPAPGDSHPASGLTRGVMRLVMLESDKIAAQYGLPPCDDVDEGRYLRALAPYLRAIKAAWSESNQKPLGEELGKIRGGIREFSKWKRPPTELELSEIVYAAIGQERPVVVTGADAEARQVVSAPSPRMIESATSGKRAPSWLPEFAEAVGDNELAQKTFLIPLLNMSDEWKVRSAIAAIAKGRDTARKGTSMERMVSDAQRKRQGERTGYIDDCLRSVRQIVANKRREISESEQESAPSGTNPAIEKAEE